MRCPKCHREISDSAVFCGYCGADIRKVLNIQGKEKNRKNAGLGVAISVLAALLLILGILLFILLKPTNDLNIDNHTKAEGYEDPLEAGEKREESSSMEIKEATEEISSEISVIETTEESTDAEVSVEPEESDKEEDSEKEDQRKPETEISGLQDLTSLNILSCTNSTGGVNSVNNPDEDVAIGNFTDIHGNTHENAIKFWVVNMAGYMNSESITYDVSEYTSLSGEIVCACHKSGRCERNASMYIRFYLDNVLIYESRPIDEYSLPEEYTIDLTGGSILEIECYTDASFFGESLLSGKLK